ncbi:MAG: dienelactone hydrolase family protein [Verrucomicrobiales bacterium]|nr:dienelactone hydrolase family protein [Verrucomicrobiales bacterium]
MTLRLLLLTPLLATAAPESGSLPGSSPLPAVEDRSAALLEAAHHVADRFALQSSQQRQRDWASGLSADAQEFRKDKRALMRRLLGMESADEDANATPVALETVAEEDVTATGKEKGIRFTRVRWPVRPGIWGEGLLLSRPSDAVIQHWICLPDADTPPEQFATTSPVPAALLAVPGTQVLIPALIDRGSAYSVSDTLARRAAVSHREWIYRQTFVQGRHLLGMEMEMVLAAVRALDSPSSELHVQGEGEGGLLALWLAALEPRLQSAWITGYFGPREALWQEPIERNVQGWLRDFGDAEMLALISPRPVALEQDRFPHWTPPPAAAGERFIAAPSALKDVPLDQATAELDRARKLLPQSKSSTRLTLHPPGTPATAILESLGLSSSSEKVDLAAAPPTDPQRMQRLVRQASTDAQRELARGEAFRDQHFWKTLPTDSLPAFENATTERRQAFWNDVIGRAPDPDQPPNAASRMIRSEAGVVIHEVQIPVWQDFDVWGWLALPQGWDDGKPRPVVVCQHGLEGLPADLFETDLEARAWRAYKAYALRLAEQGFVVFAPHHLYRGGDVFRSLQRKLNGQGLSLFSLILAQHQSLLAWLKTQPFADAQHVGFYGLSYGGKSAMRIPSVLTDYAFSICSGDFNEWVRKCASTDMPMSYVFTGEYEIWEWDLGHRFNYAEMAALIAPRPFMVERGHSDGVGTDSWVAYEFAKVRRLYTQLGMPERTEIEFFDGPHTIHGVGSFDFVKRWLPIAP